MVSAAVACITYIFFQIFGTSKIQDWNYQGVKTSLNCVNHQDTIIPLKLEKDEKTTNTNSLEKTNNC